MKLGFALAACAAVALSGCGTIGLPNSRTGQEESWAAAALEIAKDTNCGHTDDLDIMLGPISQGHIKLNRTCPQPVAKAPPPPASEPAPGP